MPDHAIRMKYGIDEVLRRIPDDRAEFFGGFAPWAEDLAGWALSARELEREVAGRSQLRTIWDHREDHDSRLLVDVAVCPSAADAVESLAAQLAYNQLERLPEGPRDLGLASFAHPEPAPPAILFVRGNLSLVISSFGRRPVPVISIAGRFTARLAERPVTERRTLLLAAGQPKGRPGQEIVLSYESPYKTGEDGYWKFFVTGGTLVRRQGRLVLRSKAPGRLDVQAFLVESGREPQFGELTLPIE